MMEHVIASGKADLISMCGSFIREPDLINPWLSGDTSPSQCDCCDGCLRTTKRSEKLQCIVTIRASETPKKGA
jgi:2,4-dienoyl-CoA reductase-like NADH-dependent reductase (Old Yellow Enzyme family)